MARLRSVEFVLRPKCLNALQFGRQMYHNDPLCMYHNLEVPRPKGHQPKFLALYWSTLVLPSVYLLYLELFYGHLVRCHQRLLILLFFNNS